MLAMQQLKMAVMNGAIYIIIIILAICMLWMEVLLLDITQHIN